MNLSYNGLMQILCHFYFHIALVVYLHLLLLLLLLFLKSNYKSSNKINENNKIINKNFIEKQDFSRPGSVIIQAMQ